MTGIARDRLVLPDDPEQRGRIWKQHLAPVFDIDFGRHSDLLSPLKLETYLCGEMIIGGVNAPAQRLVRDQRKVAQQGIDHVLLQFYRTGASSVSSGATSSMVTASRIAVFNLSRPVTIEAEAVSALNLILPRKMLGDPGHVEDAHGRSFDFAADPIGRVFYGYVRDLLGQLDQVDAAQAADLSQAAAALCRACLPRCNGEGVSGHALKKLTIRQFVEEAIGTADLDIAMIVSRFGLSRPTLQRLFEAEGGFASYVRERRLQRAFAVLADAGRTQAHIAEIAFRHGFRDAQTFSKAFQRRFGLAPRDVAVEPQAIGMSESGHAVLLSWMNQLL